MALKVTAVMGPIPGVVISRRETASSPARLLTPANAHSDVPQPPVAPRWSERRYPAG